MPPERSHSLAAAGRHGASSARSMALAAVAERPKRIQAATRSFIFGRPSKCQMEGFIYRFTTVKASFLVRRKIYRKYLKLRAYISNARLTGQHCCPVYAAIAQ